jgi:hypothetical protein
MDAFTLVTFWYSPVVLVSAFFYFFIKSLYCLVEFTAFNPVFEKKRIKNMHQLTAFVNRITPVILVYYTGLLFVHYENVIESFKQGNFTLYCLPLFVLVLYVFLRICELYFFKSVGTGSQLAPGISTSGVFILAFIPVATALFSASSIIELLLPLELLGFLFYFIFLEYNYSGYSYRTTQRNNSSHVMRGLLYYFWLSFVGSALFVLSMLLNLIFLPSTGFYLIYTDISTAVASVITVLTSSFIFIGLSLKMGGFFFFFFKSDLYKVLPVFGVLLFSIYTSVFYLFLLFYLSSQIFFFTFCFRMLVSSLVFTLAVYSLLFGNLTQRNILILAGFSSVLTICFCILIVL